MLNEEDREHIKDKSISNIIDKINSCDEIFCMVQDDNSYIIYVKPHKLEEIRESFKLVSLADKIKLYNLINKILK